MTQGLARTSLGTWQGIVARAARAPSVHNTQPWRFVVRKDGTLEVHADRRRQLHVLDPRGRQMRLSIGCAVFNARVALAAAGMAVSVDRRVDKTQPDVIARIMVTGGSPDPELARLDGAIEARRTNRRRFFDDPVEMEVLARLAAAAEREHARLIHVYAPQHKLALGRLSQIADRYELADPAYRAELRRWTTDDPRRNDGVQASSVPLVDGPTHDELPLRDFDTAGMGWLPSDIHSTRSQCLLLLTTEQDDAPAWARAGEALERVLLQLTVDGYAASPLTQVIEVAHTHALLRSELALSSHPQLLIRVGRAPAVLPTRRRRLFDVLSIES